uniref:Protein DETOXIFICATION n=1 Tax=Oryza punctata TaxID=4537 RepID=A0A0E0JEC2_ORYPU
MRPAAAAADGEGDEEDDDAAVAGADDEDRFAPRVFSAESRRLWATGEPIAFNVICLWRRCAGRRSVRGRWPCWASTCSAHGSSSPPPPCFSRRSPLYIFAAPILRLLGQEESIAAAARESTLRIIPQMFALAINFPTQKFLQAQSKVTVLAWIGFAALLTHVGLLALFVSVLCWGIAGAAAVYDVSSWLTALAQVPYVVGWCRDGRTGL